MILPNRLGNQNPTLAVVVADDVTDGTDSWTNVDPNINVHDMMGCNQFIVGIGAQEFVQNTGASSIEAKVF